MVQTLFPVIEPTLPDSLVAGLADRAPARAVIVGAAGEAALRAALDAQELGLIAPILVGNGQDIQRLADAQKRALDDVPIIDADGEAEIGAASVTAFHDHNADLVIKGQIHTDVYLRTFLRRTAGLRDEDGPAASHMFHMSAPMMGKDFILTDAAFHVAPSIEQRIAIAGNAIAAMHKLGVARPNVAVLSATETPAEAMPSSLEAEEIVAVLNKDFQANAFGPVALDLALSGHAAQTKGYAQPGCGNIDILLVPTIETGNALFKLMVYALGACAAGVVVGLKAPLVLTSRADALAARLASIALAARISGHPKGR